MKKIVELLVVLGVLAGVTQGQTTSSAMEKGQTLAGSSLSTNEAAYVIGVEDVLSVNVWREPEVSGSVSVRPDGKISLPLLNDIQAAGLTPIQLANQIADALGRYVESPLVTVTVTAMNSHRIYLSGQIGRTGAMPLLKDMTVMEALTSAGCCLEFANIKKVYVLRNEEGKTVKYLFNFKEALKGRAGAQNIVLKPGDTIVVP